MLTIMTLPSRVLKPIEPGCRVLPTEYLRRKPVGDRLEIVTETAEFTSVCPFSGLPDFARVSITYSPGEQCIELRSLKYYLLSYRDVGIWYEHLVNRMLEDLVKACQPRHMKIVIVCNPRGGLTSTVTAEYTRESAGR